MGKGNRVRINKAEEMAKKQSAFASQNKKKQTPAWVSLVAVISVIVLLLGCVTLIVVSESGIVQRSTVVAKSEHYSVNGTMLSYFFRQNYNYFVGQYGQYISYLGLDTGKSLKNQEAMSGEGTWFDYFMEPTLREVREMLVYCEEANARGIKLDDEDYKKIDDAMDSLKEAAAEYNYSLSAYITALYGNGVKKSDVEASLKLSQLASKCMKIVTDEFTDAITAEDIDKYFEEHPETFLTADVLTYVFNASAEDNEDNYAADKVAIEEKGKALAACKSDEEFKKFIAEYVAEKEYADVYKKYAEKYEDNLLPDAATIEARRAAVLAAAVDNALNDKTVEKTTSEEAVDVIFNGVETDLTSSVKSALDKLLYEGYGYTTAEDDEAGLWISDSGRAVGDSKYFAKEDTEGDFDNYSVTVYRMVTTMKRNDTFARDIGHILIKSSSYENKADAEAKAQEVLNKFKAGTMSKETFEALGNEYTEDSSVFYYDVIPGQMVESFNDWMFDEARQVGDTDIVETTYGFHVMYYLGENTDKPTWKVTATNLITSENVEKWYDAKLEALSITVNEDKANGINA